MERDKFIPYEEAKDISKYLNRFIEIQDYVGDIYGIIPRITRYGKEDRIEAHTFRFQCKQCGKPTEVQLRAVRDAVKSKGFYQCSGCPTKVPTPRKSDDEIIEFYNNNGMSFLGFVQGDGRRDHKLQCKNCSSEPFIVSPGNFSGCQNCKKLLKKNDRYKQVLEYINNTTSKLLSDINLYQNQKSELEFLCLCGNKFKKTYKEFHKYPNCGQCVIARTKATSMKNWGYDSPSKHPEVKAKIVKSNEATNEKNPEIAKKRIQTNKDNHGGVSNLALSGTRARAKLTMVEKYGKSSYLCSDAYFQKMELLYGVKYPMQNQEIFEKALKSAFKVCKFITEDKRVIEYQGYELLAYQHLLQTLDKDKILFSRDKDEKGLHVVPSIKYKDFDGKDHTYFPDLMYGNTLIEVKSEYTYKKACDYSQDFKWRACIEQGYEFMLIVIKDKIRGCTNQFIGSLTPTKRLYLTDLERGIIETFNSETFQERVQRLYKH